MAIFNEPTQWEHPLGNNADISTLPDDATATAGIASLQKLFQIINATPLEAGGIAPDREDVNALFKYLGDQIFYTQNGGIPSYNADYDYIPGRVIIYTDNKLYKCIQANGASSTVVAPDNVSPLGSDYWVQVATLADFTSFANKDFSNVSAPVQTFKDMSIGWGMPDYSSGVNITSSLGQGQTWTAPKSGILIHTSLNDNGACYISHTNANNISNYNLPNWLIYNNTGTGDYQSAMAIVNKNLVVYGATNSNVLGTLMFYPCKGA